MTSQRHLTFRVSKPSLLLLGIFLLALHIAGVEPLSAALRLKQGMKQPPVPVYTGQPEQTNYQHLAYFPPGQLAPNNLPPVQLAPNSSPPSLHLFNNSPPGIFLAQHQPIMLPPNMKFEYPRSPGSHKEKRSFDFYVDAGKSIEKALEQRSGNNQYLPHGQFEATYGSPFQGSYNYIYQEVPKARINYNHHKNAK